MADPCCLKQSSPCKAQSTDGGYRAVQIACGVIITALAIKALPKHFFASVAVGVGVHVAMKQTSYEISQDLTLSPEACVSGCTDIVAQSYGIKFDPRISLIIATLFFCCHIEHHAREMVPVVGFALGARIFHMMQSKTDAK